MSTMPQAVYVSVMTWVAEVNYVTRFRHIADWDLANIAYDHLALSTTAWSPSRPAVYQVALRLFMYFSNREMDAATRLNSRLERQVRRAMMTTGLPLNPQETIVEWVRHLALAYRVERAVAVGMGRGRQRAAADQLRRVVNEVFIEDADSSSTED